MQDDNPALEENLKQAIEERVREKLPAIQKEIQTQTGKRLTEHALAEILSEPMADVATEVTLQATYAYAGPMPSPHVMRGYADLFPGAPEQLFEQFKEEQRHRHEWENSALTATKNERSRRDIGAYCIAALGIGGAGWIGYLGALNAAAILIGAIVLGGGALVLGRQFFASHGNDGTQVSLQPDGSDSHRDLRSERAHASKKANGQSHKSRSRRNR